MNWITTLLLYGIIITAVNSIATNSPVPPDRLIPPPANQALVLKYAQPLPEPTFIQRIARWFGFGGNNNNIENISGDIGIGSVTESHATNYNNIKNEQEQNNVNQQQTQQQQQQPEIQHRYSDLSAPIQQQQTVQKQPQKAGCNPCNKVPWTPMFHHEQQLPVIQSNKQAYNPPLAAEQAFQQRPVPAVSLQYRYPAPMSYQHQKRHQLNPYKSNYFPENYKQQQQQPKQHIALPTYPSYIHPTSPATKPTISPVYQPPYKLLPIQQSDQHLIPIPIPNLSVTPIPPLYDAKPFRFNQFSHNNMQQDNRYDPYSTQQLGAAPAPFRPAQTLLPSLYTVPPQSQRNVPSDTLSSANSDIEVVKSVSVGQFPTSIEYPPEIIQSPTIDLSKNQEANKYSKAIVPQHNQYLSDPIVVSTNNDESVTDSYPSASSNNLTRAEFAEQVRLLLQNEDNNIIEEQSTIDSLEETDSPAERGKISVTFEPSIQTEIEKNKNYFSSPKIRDTPIALLDSPKLHQKKNIEISSTNNPSEFKTTKPPVLDYSPWRPSSPISFLSTVYNNPATVSPYSTTLIAKSTPPPQITTDKKPKQIQIIIPYTTNNHPSPFKSTKYQNFDRSAGWSHQSNNENDMNNEDFEDSQESKLVTTTVTQAPSHRRTTKYLTKVLASSLKELLKKEKSHNYSSVDLSRLQKNIDGWTEQEFSALPNKASTISFFSKHIPSEYLTTTPLIKRYSTTTVVDDNLLTTTLEPLLADEEYKKIDYFGKIIDNNRIEQHRTTQPQQYTPVPFSQKTNRITSEELWNKLRLSISPITKEKVYVVTPQPYHSSGDRLSDFKSPRFAIRPTPGVGVSAVATTNSDDKLTLSESINRLQTTATTEKTTTNLWNADLRSSNHFAFRPSTQLELVENS